MHNVTTKQRLSALRRRFGIWTTLPRWARERRVRAAAPAPAADPLAATVAMADPLAATVALADPAAALPPPVPVMQPTPPLSDLAAWDREAAEPSAALRRRRRGIAAGVLAGIVLVLLAVLALVPWLRGRAPAESATAAATPAAPPAPIATPTPAANPAPTSAVAPSPRPAPPVRGEEGGTPASTAALIQVRTGDTLWDLAAAHLGDPMRWPLLHEANRGIVKDPNLIYPGQSLRIPAG